MRGKKRDYEAEMEESAAYLSKLNHVTAKRKSNNSKNQHKFQALTELQELKSTREKLEEEIQSFMLSKHMAAELKTLDKQEQERNELKDSLSTQVYGLKDLIQTLKVHCENLKGMPKAREQWTEKTADIKLFIDELKEDFRERKEATQIELEEFEDIFIESEPIPAPPDTIMDNLPVCLDVQKIKDEYETAVQRLRQAFSEQLSQIEEPSHDWPKDKHEEFLFLHKMYIEKGKPREKYMERLKIQFPYLNRSQIEAHDAVIEKLRWAKKHKKNILKDYQRHRKAMAEAAEALLGKEMDLAIDNMNKTLEHIKQEKRNQRIQQDISKNLPDYIEKVDEKRKNEEALRQQQKKEETLKQNARQSYLSNVKNKAQEFSYKKNQEIALEERKKAREEQRNKEKAQESIRRNMEKVNRRQEDMNRKIKDKFEQGEIAREEKIRKQERIERAVQNYPHVPHVEIDRDRVSQPTKSLKAKNTKFDKADQISMYSVTGFTAENLMKDMRYRLAHNLAQAGLSHSEYGKKMLHAAPPAQPPRRDMLSTFNIH